MDAPELSAIVLCYGAAESVYHVINPLYHDLEDSGVPFELVLVANYDEGANDHTPEIARKFAEAHPHVSIVARPKQGAMGWDMRTGLAAARGDFLVVIDGDEQNPVEDLLESYRQMKRRGLDVVKGRRIARFDGYWRHLTSIAFNLVFMLVFRTYGLWDINGKPKGMTREAYERMSLRSDDWFADAEIVLQAIEQGLRIGEVPVVFRQNLERRSFVRPSAIVEFLGNIIRHRVRRRR